MDKIFNACIIGCNLTNGVPYYTFKNLETKDTGTVPCWCLDDFAIFNEQDMDPNGHLRIGAEVQLIDMGNGKFYPGLKYERKPRERSTSMHRQPARTMSKESLYEGTEIYNMCIQDDIENLWKEFEDNCDKLSQNILVEGIKTRNKGIEEQKMFLISALGLNKITSLIQESTDIEFKSSFMHTPYPKKINEKVQQYRNIFAEIVAFANSHLDGKIYVGINNDGSINGLENELLNEAPFSTRADFEADFLNQLFMATQNNRFASSISLKWYKTKDEHIFCKIIIPEWNGDIIFLNGSELFIRGNACKRHLKNNDMIQYIVANYKAIA